MQISGPKTLAVKAWPKPKPSLSIFWLTALCPCSTRKKSFNLFAPKFPNRTTLTMNKHSSKGLQLERKLPYLPTICSVSPPLTRHGKPKVKTVEQHAHDCLTNQSELQRERDLIAPPAIPAKFPSLPKARKKPHHSPFPVVLSLGMCFWEAWQTPGFQTKQ